MDAAAQARARAKSIQQSLLQATTDDAACPPEFIDLVIEDEHTP